MTVYDGTFDKWSLVADEIEIEGRDRKGDVHGAPSDLKDRGRDGEMGGIKWKKVIRRSVTGTRRERSIGRR